jgi:hypothetical protein
MTAVADFILKDRLWPLSMECLFQADRCQRLSGFIIDFGKVSTTVTTRFPISVHLSTHHSVGVQVHG